MFLFFLSLFRSDSYYLVMEDGGKSLYDFITESHKWMKMGIIQISHWQTVVKIIFHQMLDAIQYIHSKNVCHFDISLENWLLEDPEIVVTTEGTTEDVRVVLDDIHIKLCDFGMFLSARFYVYDILMNIEYLMNRTTIKQRKYIHFKFINNNNNDRFG